MDIEALVEAEDQEAIAERNRRRGQAEIGDSKAAAKRGDLPPLEPVDLPTMMGQGKGGPHHISLVIDERLKEIQIAPFTLGTQPKARAAFDQLSAMVSVVLSAYSRQPESGRLTPESLLATMKLAMPEEKMELVDQESAAFLVSSVAVNMGDEETKALIDIIHLAASRFNTGLKREDVENSIDIVEAFQIVGKILRLNSGLSERFFA